MDSCRRETEKEELKVRSAVQRRRSAYAYCIEGQEHCSVPVRACMSHCIGMLAPGTQQLTALTSVNKLIAGGCRTTQSLW